MDAELESRTKSETWKMLLYSVRLQASHDIRMFWLLTFNRNVLARTPEQPRNYHNYLSHKFFLPGNLTYLALWIIKFLVGNFTRLFPFRFKIVDVTAYLSNELYIMPNLNIIMIKWISIYHIQFEDYYTSLIESFLLSELTPISKIKTCLISES